MRQRRQSSGRRKPRASTQDIVGNAQAAPRIRPKWRPYFDQLMRMRDHISNRQVDLASDALQEQPAFSTHMADAATDTFNRDLALSMLSSEQDAVYQIDQALDRIRNGTYGICELTGKPIEEERLKAIPWTRFTAEAERQLEREGVDRRHTRLGQRDTVAQPGLEANRRKD